MNKLYRNKIVMFIILLFFFKPICFQYYSQLRIVEKIFVYGKITIAIIIVLDEFLVSAKSLPILKINKTITAILCFEIWILIMTLLKNGNISRAFINMVSMWVISLIVIKLYILDKYTFFKIINVIMLILLILQLISEIIYPTGMNADLYKNNRYNPLFFMTIDNGTTVLLCFSLIIFIFNDYYNNTNPKNKLILFKILMIILTAIFSGSSTALICSIIFIILWRITFLNKNFDILDNTFFWLIIYFIILGILMSSENIFSKLFYLITGKEGFTGRTYLWSKSVELIKENCIFGYGIQAHDFLRVWGGYYSSHNVILEMVLQGGIIALLLWINILNNTRNNLKLINNYKIKRSLIITIYTFLVAFFMESSVHSIYFFFIIALIFAISRDKELKNE